VDIQVATEFHRAVLGFEQVVLRRRSHGYPSSEAVARGAIAAIEQDRGEVDAADLLVRIVAKLGGLARASGTPHAEERGQYLRRPADRGTASPPLNRCLNRCRSAAWRV